MTKITQEQLIESLNQLKGIKPRREWAVLLKSQILSEQKEVIVKAQSVGFMDVISAIFAPKKLVYVLSSVLFLVVGIFGFAEYTVPGDLLFPVRRMAEQSQAVLTGQTGLKQDVAIFNSRINDLAQVAKAGNKNSISSAMNEVNANVSELTKNLKNNPAESAQTMKDIAVGLKTLASVSGTDLTGNPEVKDLYQTVVQSQIADLQKMTLTDEQKKTLTEVENLYDQAKYSDALEKILLINK